jgi:hypothetical protein
MLLEVADDLVIDNFFRASKPTAVARHAYVGEFFARILVLKYL